MSANSAYSTDSVLGTALIDFVTGISSAESASPRTTVDCSRIAVVGLLYWQG